MIKIHPLLGSFGIAVIALYSVQATAQGVLYSRGGNRLLVEGADTTVFTAQPTGSGMATRYRTGIDARTLVGSRGRYRLHMPDGSTRHFVAGHEVDRTLFIAPLPASIEGKRPPQASVSSTRLDSLLVREHDATPTCPEHCDTENTPASEAFVAGPSIDEAITQDVRPANCESYFTEYVGIDRGVHVEEALAHAEHYQGTVPTVRSFPLVDFIGLGEARIVRSRDLASESYSTPGSLHERLLRDGREIAEGLLQPLAEDGFIERTEQGETTRLEASPPLDIVLEVVVQHGMASNSQIDEFRDAASDLVSQWGIILRIIEIP